MRYIIILLLTASSAFGAPADKKAFNKQYAFFERYADDIIQASKETPGLLPSVALAQAALETGYGTSYLYKQGRNLYGIKYTRDHKGGSIWSSKEGAFRKYKTGGESIRDRFRLLSKVKRYKKVTETMNPYEQVDAIAAAGYAEARNYAQVIKGIIDAYDLTKYDDMLMEQIRMEQYTDLQQSLIRYITLQHQPIRHDYAIRSFNTNDSDYRLVPIPADTGLAIRVSRAKKQRSI